MNIYRFRHYKGGIYYKIGTALREGDKEPMTIYHDEAGRVWVRPTVEFNEKFYPEG